MGLIKARMSIRGRIFAVQQKDLHGNLNRSAFLLVARWSECLFANGAHLHVDLFHCLIQSLNINL